METLKTSNKNILIVQTAFLGDLLLTLPLIYHLKRIFTYAQIDILIREGLEEIKEIFTLIDNVHLISKKNSRKIESIISLSKIMKGKYNVVITPHRSFRSGLISFLTHAEKRITFNNSSLPFLFTDIVKYDKSKHEIERNLDLLNPILSGQKINWKEKIPLKLDDYILNEIFMYWKSSGEKIIAIAPGTVWETKRYPEYYFSVLINRLINDGIKCVLIGSSKDLDIGTSIMNRVSNKDSVLNLIGKLSLKESISLINLSDLLICNDSAPTHMGVFTKTPVLTIYGSTVPEFGFYPFRNFDRYVEVENLTCKPCGIHGYQKCPKKHFKCMIDLLPSKIYQVAISMLNSN